jgi:hypothetical protein
VSFAEILCPIAFDRTVEQKHSLDTESESRVETGQEETSVGNQFLNNPLITPLGFADL